MLQLGWILKTLNERSQTRKATYWIVLFTWNVRNGQVHMIEIGGQGMRKRTSDHWWICFFLGGKGDENILKWGGHDSYTTLCFVSMLKPPNWIGFFLKKEILIFIYLFILCLRSGYAPCAGSSSLTREGTHVPCIGSGVLTTGLLGKFPNRVV